MRSERDKEEEEDEEQEEREVTLVADFIELVSNRSSRVSNCAGSCLFGGRAEEKEGRG